MTPRSLPVGLYRQKLAIQKSQGFLAAMNTHGNDFPDKDAMGSALDFLLTATVEAREAAGQYRGARSEDSPFALREALGMGAAFHPGEALGDADLGMAQDVDAEIAPFANPCVSFPPPVDAYEQLRGLS